jgi:hypothetical protein
MLSYGSPVPLAKFRMTPIPSTLIPSGSKKKEPRYVYLSEGKGSHSHRMWTEVSSSVSHYLQMELLPSPIICRCLLKALCPVSRPITTLDCILLKGSNRAPVARLGPKINFRACLCVVHRNAQRPLMIQGRPLFIEPEGKVTDPKIA